MTAEIAVFNKSAVALAADSAVTITGDGTHKIYNGAEKLFTLSKFHPVGVMIYGNGDICGAPWELAIKSYRSENGTRSFNSLKEWADNFLSFISENDSIVTEGMREKYLFNFHSSIILPALINDVEKKAEALSTERGEIIKTAEFYDLFIKYCTEFVTTLEGAPYFDGFDEDDLPEAAGISDQYVDFLCTEQLRFDDEVIPFEIIELIKTIFTYTTCKKAPIGSRSGIVFAGYGDGEYYPVVLSYDILGFLGRKVRTIFNTSKSSLASEANILPYAQDQEVQLFLQGCYDEFLEHNSEVHESCRQDIKNNFKEILIKYISPDDAEKELAVLDGLINDCVESTNTKINSFINTNYIQKVISMLGFLPKQELAYMAESLVNLTAFKRKVSNEHETVGGPIDVAIISKADGFIWVKRKHYFSRELNHHFFVKHQRDS
ncbi:Uncharacterised protein [Serratia marcescens]|uniref:hypothetical protein n=1 Tax=Serratia TaxID=613 RepID=UPI000F7F3297|nr:MULTISPECIES: hypothetical protein [Serratia]EGS5643879.1 hypothetical protein [Serratia marcescens]EIJ9189432.1 hypothetical protein [Serratia marcescens]MBH2523020.1 hypothetical protein [Serratia marcescens]MBH2621056.1 hypothetical protein [Serratia marcescens]MBH2783287.1 hypothetical protein [Serratia marcescens]